MCKQACLVIPHFLVPELTRKNVLLKLGGDSGIMKGWKSIHPCSWVKGAAKSINPLVHSMGLYLYE